MEAAMTKEALDKAVMFFVILNAIGAMLWLKGPAANPVQFVFRIALCVVAVVGLVVLLILRKTRSQ